MGFLKSFALFLLKSFALFLALPIKTPRLAHRFSVSLCLACVYVAPLAATTRLLALTVALPTLTHASFVQSREGRPISPILRRRDSTGAMTPTRHQLPGGGLLLSSDDLERLLAEGHGQGEANSQGNSRAQSPLRRNVTFSSYQYTRKLGTDL